MKTKIGKLKGKALERAFMNGFLREKAPCPLEGNGNGRQTP
jgi:hypothetical protein